MCAMAHCTESLHHYTYSFVRKKKKTFRKTCKSFELHQEYLVEGKYVAYGKFVLEYKVCCRFYVASFGFYIANVMFQAIFRCILHYLGFLLTKSYFGPILSKQCFCQSRVDCNFFKSFQYLSEFSC